MPKKTLAQIMSAPVRQIGARNTLAEAAELMARDRISSLLVVNDSQPIGIVTERDLLRALDRHESGQSPVSTTMTSPVLSAPADLDYRDGHHLLVQRGIRHLLVTDAAGGPVGIVSETDFRQQLGYDYLARFNDLRGFMHPIEMALPPDVLLSQAIRHMEEHGQSCIIAIEDERAVGILTERDLVRLMAQRVDTDRVTLRAAMSSPVKTIAVGTSLLVATQVMQAATVRHIVVVANDGRAIGVITDHDILAQFESDLVGEIQADNRDAELKLRSYEQRLTTMFTQSLDGVYFATLKSPITANDLDGAAPTLSGIAMSQHITQINDAALALYGLPRKAMLGRTLIEIFPDGGPLTDPQWRALFDRGHVRSISLGRRADGQAIWIEGDYIVMHDYAGRITGHFGIQRDITARLEADRRLAIERARLRGLIDSISDLIYFKDPDGVYLGSNKAFAEFVGRAEQDLIGRTDRDFFGPDLAAMLADSDRRMLATGRPIREEEWIASLDRDSATLFETVKTPYFDAAGRPLGLIGVSRDITDRHRRESQGRLRNRIFELLAEHGPINPILEAVALFLEAAIPDARAAVLLVDKAGARLSARVAPNLPHLQGADLARLDIAQAAGPCGGAAIRSRQSVVEDIGTHPECASPYCQQALDCGHRACWSEPINGSTGKVLGAVTVYLPRVGAPSPSEIRYLQEGAQLARIAIERRQSDEELQLAASVFHASGEAIVVTDADNLIVAVNPAFTAITGYSLSEVAGMNPKVLKSNRQDSSFYASMWESLLTSGSWQGEIWNKRKNGEIYPEWVSITRVKAPDGHTLRHVAIFSDITEKKQAEEIIWHQANYDKLTSLPNRSLFQDRLDQEIRKASRVGGQFALLFIDLDRFKEVNDSFGHDAGDRLLIEAARRLKAAVRDTDTVARLGGDEFTVILSGLSRRAHVDSIAQKIIGKLAKPYDIGDLAFVTASIGITLFPNDGRDIETLLKNADQAMYAAKAVGRNNYSFFTERMQADSLSRMQTIQDLHHALPERQFDLYFQPIVDLRSGTVIKAEALLRWNHPERGPVPPSEFIPIAEEIGLIGELGDWVFRESVRLSYRWLEMHRDHHRRLGRRWRRDRHLFQVSINKSPRQFLAPGGGQDWLDHLDAVGLPARCIAIEITEGLLLEDRPEVAERLLAFRDAGVEVSLDDFGTGYSAMSYLQKFDIDYVKIDRSFVRDLQSDAKDGAIAEAVTAMAHKLGMRVVAEGIETVEQRNFLIAAGCDFGQGYLFAKPMPADAFEAFMAERMTLQPDD